MKKIVMAVLVFCGLGAVAADLVIQSLDSDGRLIFTGIPYVSVYHIEQKPSVTGSWVPLHDLAASGTGSITSTVPLTATTGFFRVVAVNRTVPEGMVEILAGTNSGLYPDLTNGTYSLTVSTFCIDTKEMSKFQWNTVYSWAVTHDYSFDNPGDGKALNNPVMGVSWYDCVKWCNARSEMEGKDPCYTVDGNVYKTGQSSPLCDVEVNGYRLPTTTEWQYAARGGLSAKRFPWGDTITHSQANYFSDATFAYDISPTRGRHPSFDVGGDPYTSPVGTFPANNYGLYDMSGNVWEWCTDSVDSGRAVQGGGYSSTANEIAFANMTWYGATADAYVDCGFRTVCR